MGGGNQRIRLSWQLVEMLLWGRTTGFKGRLKGLLCNESIGIPFVLRIVMGRSDAAMR